MMMLETITLVTALIGLAAGWFKLRQIRINDLAHLERTLERIEGKIDAHLQWHAEH